MSLKEAAEKYSKKWGVSPEEAEKKIKQMLDNAGTERKKAVPSLENIFPEPLGDISKKIQDVNQAVLSTAYTRKVLDTPSEEAIALRDRIGKIENIVGELKTGLETKIKELTETLEDKNRKEARREMLEELDSKMNPLRESLKDLSQRLEKAGEGGEGGSMEAGSVLDEANKVAEKAKGWLVKMGYKVEPEKLSKQEVMKMIDEAQKQALANMSPEDLRKRLEKTGYKVVGGPISYDQLEKIMKGARKQWEEETLDDKRIDAAAEIVKTATRQIVSMFQPAVSAWMEGSLASRAPEHGSPPSKKK